jgi:hypothetical protein
MEYGPMKRRSVSCIFIFIASGANYEQEKFVGKG